MYFVLFYILTLALDVRPVSSEETIASSAETIPYCDDWAMIERGLSSSESTISADSDEELLLTHHYISLRPEAPLTSISVINFDEPTKAGNGRSTDDVVPTTTNNETSIPVPGPS